MSEYSRRLEERKREARQDYLNRLYHKWNVLMARDKMLHMAEIKFVEGKIHQEEKRRKDAGWPSSFTEPENWDGWDELPDYISVCSGCELHIDDDLETIWDEHADPWCPDCFPMCGRSVAYRIRIERKER